VDLRTTDVGRWTMDGEAGGRISNSWSGPGGWAVTSRVHDRWGGQGKGLEVGKL